MKNNNLSCNGFSGNAAQNQAITHVNGPAIVLAGPGSGKTFVITRRLKYLIEEKKIDPSTIMVITFTKAAAMEMQQRFLKITDSSYPEILFGTFHSIFYQIIRSANKSNSQIEIASESFKYKIIKDILFSISNIKKEIDNTYLEESEIYKEIFSEISRIKNSALEPSEHLKSIPLEKHFEYIYHGYNKMLKEFNRIDFDDMIQKCYEILVANKELLCSWQDRFKYYLIDEYQDINLMQYKVIRLLSGKTNNLFVVGDDDQSIYGFRGSDPGIMLEFKKDFEEESVKEINLNINYRCARNILVPAVKMIEENTVRYKKTLIPAKSSPEGYLYTRAYINKKQELDAIAYFLLNNRICYKDVAIICRTNSECRSVADYLKLSGISSNLDSGKTGITDDPGVSLCLDYLKFSVCANSREYFLKIMNKPMRYITREAITCEKVTESEVIRYYKENGRKIKVIKKLFNDIRMIAHMRPSLSLRYIRKEIGVDKLFETSSEALDKLEEYAKEALDNKELISMLERLGEDKSSENKAKTGNNEDKLNIMTMHASKGLEFNIVILPNLNEGIIPSRSAITKSQIEEERRMLYVAMTRAKQALIMCYCTGTKENQMLPSRFLRPIKDLWNQRDSESSSGSSTSSSNSTSSRYKSNASETASYSASSLM